jgi:hypothetical protein
MASGTGGQFALAKVNSLYSTVNTVNLWANFASETLDAKITELEEGSISGLRDAPNTYKGIVDGSGAITIEPNPNVICHFLKAWFGTSASSTVTAAGSTGASSNAYAGAQVSYHKFTPNQNAYSDRTFLDPYNFMIYRDVGSAWLFQGTIVPKLKIDFKAGQLVKGTVDVMARQANLIQRVGAIQSLVSSGGRPWSWDMTSVEISTDVSCTNLAANTEFEEISVTFDMKHEGVVLLDGTNNYAEFVPNDFRRITIDGTMSFRDQVTYQSFIAYNAVRMRLTALNTNSLFQLGNPNSADATKFGQGYFGIRMHIPQMKFVSWSAPITGPKRIVAKFQAKAEYSYADGISFETDVTAIVNSSDLTTTY